MLLPSRVLLLLEDPHEGHQRRLTDARVQQIDAGFCKGRSNLLVSLHLYSTVLYNTAPWTRIVNEIDIPTILCIHTTEPQDHRSQSITQLFLPPSKQYSHYRTPTTTVLTDIDNRPCVQEPRGAEYGGKNDEEETERPTDHHGPGRGKTVR